MAGGDRVIANLDRWVDRKQAAMVALARRWSVDLEGQMRDTAPWTDRTGAARAGLFSDVRVGPDELSIILAHGVDYGVYLELANNGKYAILWPTATANRSEEHTSNSSHVKIS